MVQNFKTKRSIHAKKFFIKSKDLLSYFLPITTAVTIYIILSLYYYKNTKYLKVINMKYFQQEKKPCNSRKNEIRLINFHTMKHPFVCSSQRLSLSRFALKFTLASFNFFINSERNRMPLTVTFQFISYINPTFRETNLIFVALNCC